MSDIIRIGDKIILRKITLQDTDDIVRWRNSPTVMNRFIIRTPLSKDVHEAWMRDRVATGLVEQLIIVIKDSNKSIGSVYFRDVDHNNATAEFGIFIGEEDEQHKGYGYEAQKLALDYAFNELGLTDIMLRVLDDNNTAIANYKKCGFSIIEDREEIVTIEGYERRVLFMSLHGVN